MGDGQDFGHPFLGIKVYKLRSSGIKIVEVYCWKFIKMYYHTEIIFQLYRCIQTWYLILEFENHTFIFIYRARNTINLIKIGPFISLSICFCRSWKTRAKKTNGERDERANFYQICNIILNYFKHFIFKFKVQASNYDVYFQHSQFSYRIQLEMNTKPFLHISLAGHD